MAEKVKVDPLTCEERMRDIQRKLDGFKQARYENGKICKSSADKLNRDVMLYTINNMDFYAKHSEKPESKDLWSKSVYHLEEGLNKQLLEAAREARSNNDEAALKEIAQQYTCLTLRKAPYAKYKGQIAFGEALLAYMHKFKSLPDSRKSFEEFMQQYDFLILNTLNRKTLRKTKAKNEKPIFKNNSTYEECFQTYEVNDFIQPHKTRSERKV